MPRMIDADALKKRIIDFSAGRRHSPDAFTVCQWIDELAAPAVEGADYKGAKPERPLRPAMLLAKVDDWVWMCWADDSWNDTDGNSWPTRMLAEVDEAVSDPEAIDIWRKEKSRGQVPV